MNYSLSSAIDCIESNLKRGIITTEQAKQLIAAAYAKYKLI